LDENLLTAYYNHTSLTTNQTYYYRVIAFRTVSGVTTTSAESVIVSATPVPTAPTNVSVTLNSYNSLNISWDAVGGATRYEVSRAESSTGEFTPLYLTDHLNITDNNLVTGKYYYYKVRAFIDGDPIVYGDYSSIKSLKVIPKTPVISVKANTYTSLKISWAEIEGATGYRIYRATSKTGTYSYIKTTTALSYTDTGRTTGKYYYYKVKAYTTNEAGTTYSAYSAYKYAKVVPSTPTSTAVSAGYNSIKISWNSVSGRTAYQLYRATSEGGTYSLIKTTTSTSYTNTSLITGKTYYYKVRAYRLVGKTKVYGSYSAVKSVAPVPATPKPTADNYSYTSNKISWAKISGASGYELYETNENGDIIQKLDLTSPSALYYIHEGLTTNTPYYYKVAAYRTMGENKVYGSYSAVVSATPYLQLPL
jgi:fibronectin type 3 domain-containing protein